MFRCNVCHQKFKDLHRHLGEPAKRQTPEAFLRLIASHEQKMKEIKKSLYKCTCFCGGHITFDSGAENNNWEITCDNCKYLYGED